MVNAGIPLHPGGEELTLSLADRAGLRAGDRVLDVGCGTGASLALLREHFRIRPFGADLSEQALSLARELCPEADLRRSDAASLPYPEGFFDAVLMECALTLFRAPEEALSEAFRVLRPGGTLILSSLVSLSAPETGGDGLVRNGLLLPAVFEKTIESFGGRITESEDRKTVLYDYIAESIFRYGSLQARIREETLKTGGSVLDCNIHYDPKSTGYRTWILRTGREGGSGRLS